MRIIWIIAKNTFRELIRDRILYGLIFFAMILLGFSLAMGQLSFSEQARISANFGFSSIHIGAIILAIFIGSTLVAKEIEKQTILTLLVRPMTRVHFILGKCLGLLLVVLTIVVGLGFVEALIFMGLGVPIRPVFFVAFFGILLESVVLLGVTVLFSTFSRPLLVVSFSMSVFIIGHWVNNLNLLAQKSGANSFKIFATVVTTAFPNLERFNWRSLVVYNKTISIEEISATTLYSFSWFLVFFVLSSFIFSKKRLCLMWIEAIGFFIFGAIFGSFSNVVIHRLPLGKSVVKPRSHCPKCSHQIKWYENVPLLSYIFLRGKCSHCQIQIPVRYFLVEILMAFLFAGLFLWHGFNLYLLEHLIFAFGLVTVSFIDFDHMILPDSFTLSGIALGIAGSLLNPGRSIVEALAGVLMGGGFLWAVAYFYYLWRKQEGMGGGDIKLLAWIGAVLGWQSIPFVILVSCIIGSIVGLAVSFRQKKGLQTVIPFGPYLALSAVLYIFGGYHLGTIYLKVFLPGLVY